MTSESATRAEVTRLGEAYADRLRGLFDAVLESNGDAIADAAGVLADRVAADRLIHVYGPGGHSNLAAQEIFYRPGSLMHVSAILDEGTLLSSGALRSTATERTPGYGADVVAAAGLVDGDVLVLVNAFGINSAVIDAAREARNRGVTTVGVSSRAAAIEAPADHPARHPDRLNLHDVVDLHIDSHVPTGDTVIELGPAGPWTGGVSTSANAFCLQWLIMTTIAVLTERGHQAPVWRSRNAAGGDEANARGIERLQGRVTHL
ncbi:sugar isomerase domain-containing protein [Phytoactinopolyspora halotolerans]|uniref:Sugar isomerase domain-containing protein n=1 Tax=Phytoactinopolyspora halotolerans TaxID=1981512 RepID=A0A6L9S5T9_9ACTN|nr:sugar isomerase domain-containing protein [Phytoactinopolyspora halotolerans]NEE00417.1 sugar isomerase domain-containing protein [Phytoactinopolyspora halotolerans]